MLVSVSSTMTRRSISLPSCWLDRYTQLDIATYLLYNKSSPLKGYKGGKAIVIATLFTIGYQNRSLMELVETLSAHSIDTVIDIREYPLSHRKGFSKTPLSKYLKVHGIEYVHIRELGSPRKLRRELSQTGDIEAFFQKYANYLGSQTVALEEATTLAQNGLCCLLCLEADPNICHRTIVAQEIKRLDGDGMLLHHL